MKWIISALLTLSCFSPLLAGVSDEIEREYRAQYENRAMFLKLPVRGDETTVYLRGASTIIDPASMGEPLRFKVGEQVRITEVDFDNASVKFKLASIDLSQRAELIFRFAQELTYSFPQREQFDAALADSFTEGLTYRDIDHAKEAYVKDQIGRVINQFESTTGLGSEAIVQAILASTPEYARTRSQLQEANNRLATVEQELADLKENARRLESNLASARREASESGGLREALEEERDRLQQQNQAMKEDLAELRTANDRFIRELDSVTSELNLKGASNTQLGDQIETLSMRLDALMKEQSSLKAQVSTLTTELETVTGERDDLSTRLSSTERRARELQSNLNSLTSNRDSLEANFIRTKQEKESLERARTLEDALSLRFAERSNEEGARQVSKVYLLTQELGTLTIHVPSDPSSATFAEFALSSPNLVQFSEEERELFEALGDEVTAEVQWRPWSEELEAVLVSGEPSQAIAPRESAHWEWRFQGNLETAETVTGEFLVTDRNGNKILVGSREFEIEPGGILTGLPSHFSLFWLIAGILMGAAGLGLAVALRDRSRGRQKRSMQRRAYPAQKEM